MSSTSRPKKDGNGRAAREAQARKLDQPDGTFTDNVPGRDGDRNRDGKIDNDRQAVLAPATAYVDAESRRSAGRQRGRSNAVLTAAGRPRRSKAAAAGRSKPRAAGNDGEHRKTMTCSAPQGDGATGRGPGIPPAPPRYRLALLGHSFLYSQGVISLAGWKRFPRLRLVRLVSRGEGLLDAAAIRAKNNLPPHNWPAAKRSMSYLVVFDLIRPEDGRTVLAARAAQTTAGAWADGDAASWLPGRGQPPETGGCRERSTRSICAFRAAAPARPSSCTRPPRPGGGPRSWPCSVRPGRRGRSPSGLADASSSRLAPRPASSRG